MRGKHLVAKVEGASSSGGGTVEYYGPPGYASYIWEMIISYKKYPKTSIFGVSRTTLKDGKIIEQRDYYDLWGDIFDNIKFFRRGYRRFMRKRFG